MRKLVPCLVLLLLTLLVCLPASAEIYVLDSIFASIDVPDSYVVLTESNLASYGPWLESRGLTAESVTADFTKRGVLVQAWTAEYDACFEVTAVKNDRSTSLFDINQQSTTVRGGYRLDHYPDNIFIADGYEFTASDWKNTSNGRFLVLRYIKRDNAEILYRGLMRRTIRNGFEISFDMQIYGRAVSNKDNTNLNKIWDSFKFIVLKDLPAAASAKINITTVPPEETNDQSFTIEGTAAEGVKITAVVMGLSYPEPLLSDVMVGASGKFKLPIKLPKEGVFLITMTAEYQGEDVVELAYPVTYQNSLLTVNIATVVPEVVQTSELTILGTSEPGANIQVLVNGEAVMRKKVTSAGRFKLPIDTSKEGSYELILVFSKKQLADRRIMLTFSRELTDTDMLKELKKQAVKPSYTNLKKKMQGYEGSVMGYKSYLLSVTESGNEWVAQMALTKKGEKYSGIILVTCKEKPNFIVGQRVMMYGTCTGMSLASDGTDGENTAESYPCFDLLMFASLE